MKTLSTLKALPSKPLSWFKRLSFKRKVLTIIGLFILVSLIGGQVANATKPPPYTLAKAEKGDLAEIVSESGTIVTNNNTIVYSPSTGIVDEVFVQNGDSVSKGEKLYSVKSTATQQEQQAAYASYLAAKTSLDSAQANANALRASMYDKWDTYRDMATTGRYENGDGSPNDNNRSEAEFQIAQDSWKAAEATYKNSQTVISQAQAQVSSTWLLYQATQNATVMAPVDGTVANLAISPGSAVTAKSATNQQPTLSVADFGTTEVTISLNELDAVKVAPGQEVSLDVNAVDDKKYRGLVARVDQIGTQVAGVMQYNAYIQITNADTSLRSGMSVDMDITTRKIDDILLVPNAAVKPYKGGRAVRVPDPKTKEVIYKPVKIGIRGKEKTQILSGINQGEEVITSLANDQIKRPGLF